MDQHQQADLRGKLALGINLLQSAERAADAGDFDKALGLIKASFTAMTPFVGSEAALIDEEYQDE